MAHFLRQRTMSEKGGKGRMERPKWSESQSDGLLHFGLLIVLSFQDPRGAPGPSAGTIHLISAALSAFTALARIVAPVWFRTVLWSRVLSNFLHSTLVVLTVSTMSARSWLPIAHASAQTLRYQFHRARTAGKGWPSPMVQNLTRVILNRPSFAQTSGSPPRPGPPTTRSTGCCQTPS